MSAPTDTLTLPAPTAGQPQDDPYTLLADMFDTDGPATVTAGQGPARGCTIGSCGDPAAWVLTWSTTATHHLRASCPAHLSRALRTERASLAAAGTVTIAPCARPAIDPTMTRRQVVVALSRALDAAHGPGVLAVHGAQTGARLRAVLGHDGLPVRRAIIVSWTGGPGVHKVLATIAATFWHSEQMFWGDEMMVRFGDWYVLADRAASTSEWARAHLAQVHQPELRPGRAAQAVARGVHVTATDEVPEDLVALVSTLAEDLHRPDTPDAAVHTVLTNTGLDTLEALVGIDSTWRTTSDGTQLP